MSMTAEEIRARVPDESERPKLIQLNPVEEHDWQREDALLTMWNNEHQMPATMLLRTDEIGLFYPGRMHELKGAPEAGKGWLALLWVKQELIKGNYVYYFDWEYNDIVQRLKMMGAPKSAVLEGLSLFTPSTKFNDAAAIYIDNLVTTYPPAAVIFDGITAAMASNGLNSYDNNDSATFINALPRRFQDAGAAVTMVDHIPKDNDRSQRFAIGAQNKLAAIDGASYTVKNVTRMGKGLIGRSQILIDKDRPGSVRQHGSQETGLIAELTVASRPEGIEVKVLLDPPAGIINGKFLPTETMERICEFLENIKPMLPTVRQVREALGGKTETMSAAITALTEMGYLQRDGGDRKAAKLALVKMYKAPENVLTEDDFGDLLGGPERAVDNIEESL